VIARSFLFVPGDRPDRFDKAIACGAHRVVLDLEDAVAPDRKEFARNAVASAVRRHPGLIVRVNGSDTSWHADDTRALAELSEVAAVMVPKAEPGVLIDVSSRLSSLKLIALVETVRGLLAIQQSAVVKGVRRFAFGSVDFSVDSGISDVDDALTCVRTRIVLQSKLAGLPPPLDGVSLELTDVNVMAHQASRSRSLGFGGKLCIHPRQVGAVNSAFLPSLLEVEWARRVLSAFESSAGSAVAVDGRMVDLPVVEKARRVLADAEPRLRPLCGCSGAPRPYTASGADSGPGATPRPRG
jgi:citrate lyase subunit beta/citryl-CoA lyase